MEYEGKCAQCMVKNRICRERDGIGPKFCSTALYSEAIAKAVHEYDNSEIGKFAKEAAIQEAECYMYRDVTPPYKFPVKPRVQEIIEFARKMGYHKLGVAFCGALHKESAIFCKILEDHGFNVVSVMCKVGGIDKCRIGVSECEKIRKGSFEPICNPIAQAEILNTAKTDFNILVGLCVGHDSLFMKYSKAMVTIFAVKDRVLGNNPLAVIYNYDSFYDRFKQDRLEEFSSDIEK